METDGAFSTVRESHLGFGEYFFFFFVPSTVIQKALIQETGLAFSELLLTPGFHASLWQGVAWLSQEQSHG